MRWNSHFNLKDKHAFLGASKYSWINYDESKMEEAYGNWKAAQKGTRLHELASKLIEEKVTLPKVKKTLNMFVNDVIDYDMKTEQRLCYTDNCFGTADAISFKNNILRIFDLKTGKGPTSMKQLEIYTAIFCLEYDVDPSNITIDLRIYQLDNIFKHIPEPEQIKYIMNKIILFDRQIENLKQGD